MVFRSDKGCETQCGIIEAHYADVYAFCRRRAASPEDAQDLTQEVFLRFFRTSSRYRDEGKPLAYLFSIARNVCIDESRKRRFAQVPFDEAMHDRAAPDRFWDSTPMGVALARLDPADQELLELRFDQGLAVGEVAQVMGLSRFAVSRRIKRALDRLKALLAEETAAGGNGGCAGICEGDRAQVVSDAADDAKDDDVRGIDTGRVSAGRVEAQGNIAGECEGSDAAGGAISLGKRGKRETWAKP